MYVLTDKASAIGLMIVSLWCLGSWPVFFNVLERRGRLPQHTYLDYAFSTYVVACLFAFTLGELGHANEFTPNFTQQLFQENWPSVVLAVAGGVTLCVGNITMQYALAFVGISLTEVISASIAVVVGTTANYFLDGGLNRAIVLFPGVGCFLTAVFLGSLCHASNSADVNAKLSQYITDGDYRSLDKDEAENSNSALSPDIKSISGQLFPEISVDEEQGVKNWLLLRKDTAEDNHSPVTDYSPGTAEYYQLLEASRAIKVEGHGVSFGLAMAFVAGLCYAMFSPLFNLATNDQFHFLKPGVPHLVVYTTFFYFSTAFLIVAVVANVVFLYYPIFGLPKSSLSAYIADWNGRHLAILAGLVCGFGNGFQFMGGQAAGYAAADAVQALPLVGTLWGVLLFGEYHKASCKTYCLLGSMLAMFIAAVAILIASSSRRF